MTLDQAREGKRAALEMLEHYGVFETRPRDECAHIKHIKARLEPQGRPEGIKWVYVA